jgi:hypothetical protein
LAPSPEGALVAVADSVLAWKKTAAVEMTKADDGNRPKKEEEASTMRHLKEGEKDKERRTEQGNRGKDGQSEERRPAEHMIKYDHIKHVSTYSTKISPRLLVCLETHMPKCF